MPKQDPPNEAWPPRDRPWTSCPCCGGEDLRMDFDFSHSSNPAAVPGRIVTCRGCSLQFKVPSKPEVPLESYYADPSHYQFQDDLVEAEKEFGQILEYISSAAGPKATLLDVGAGAGHFLKAAVRVGFRSVGVELNADLARLASESSGTEVVAGDALSLPHLLAGREQSFQVVTLLDLIEHVRDPVKLLKDAATFLAPGGLLLVYTPNHKGLIVRTAGLLHTLSFGSLQGPLRGIYDCDHITFFAPSSLRETVMRAGLAPGLMTMIRFNPYRRGVATGTTARALKIIEALSPWCFGEFRMLLTVRAGA